MIVNGRRKLRLYLADFACDVATRNVLSLFISFRSNNMLNFILVETLPIDSNVNFEISRRAGWHSRCDSKIFNNVRHVDCCFNRDDGWKRHRA